MGQECQCSLRRRRPEPPYQHDDRIVPPKEEGTYHYKECELRGAICTNKRCASLEKLGNAYLICRACEALRRRMIGQATVSARLMLEFLICKLLKRIPRDAAASVLDKMTPFPKALFEPLAALLGSEVSAIEQTAGQRGGRKTSGQRGGRKTTSVATLSRAIVGSKEGAR